MADFTNVDASGMAPQPYRPIRAADVAKVKKNYGITKTFTKAESDTSIYNFSTKAIIDWWRKTKAEEAAAAAGSGAGGGSAPGGGGAGGGSAPGGGGYNDPALTGKPEADTSAKAREGGPTQPVKPKPPRTDPNTYAKIRESGASKPVSTLSVRRGNLNTGFREY